jgi:hypothetical protein
VTRSEVLRAILSLFDSPSYLEIGVNSGDTFFALEAARKVAVDPNFVFDVDTARSREPRACFFAVESDRYFGELIGPEERFDVIFLDGLHTFEQTLRDFCNAVHFLSDDGVIVIDDVVPNSYAASLPDEAIVVKLRAELNDPDQSWMGDVYRLVFFIDTFFQQYDYATVTENHGQLVVWRHRRPAEEVTRRRVKEIARAPFETVLIEKLAFRRRGFSQIIDRLRHRARAS